MRIITSRWFCRTCKTALPTTPLISACRNRNHEVQADLEGSRFDELDGDKTGHTVFERLSLLTVRAHAAKISPEDYWLIQIDAHDQAEMAEAGYKTVTAVGGSWPHNLGNFADWNGYPIQVET